MHEIMYLIQVFLLILHCMKQIYLFEMTACEQCGCHTYTFSSGGVLL